MESEAREGHLFVVLSQFDQSVQVTWEAWLSTHGQSGAFWQRRTTNTRTTGPVSQKKEGPELWSLPCHAIGCCIFIPLLSCLCAFCLQATSVCHLLDVVWFWFLDFFFLPFIFFYSNALLVEWKFEVWSQFNCQITILYPKGRCFNGWVGVDLDRFDIQSYNRTN